ncbi:MAG: FCD domain-containing protein [Pseudomonadota bacterium]|nr:FCD domain-containing protein [Pseudomonadota bacterium]
MSKLQSRMQVYESLRNRILNLDLKPGVALSEGALAAEYGVSRTPIREALIRLAEDGLIDNRTRHRTFVSAIRFDEVMDGQFAREALEIAVVHDVAQHMTDSVREKLRASLERQQKAVENGNFERLFQLDEQMHQMFAEASRRPGIWKFIVEHKMHTDRLRKLTLFPEHVPNLLEQHREILGALFDEDPDGAADAMRRHLRFIVEHYRELSARFPQYMELPPGPRGTTQTKTARIGRPPKLSPGQREEIVEFLCQSGNTGDMAAERFGVSPATISRIRNER